MDVIKSKKSERYIDQKDHKYKKYVRNDVVIQATGLFNGFSSGWYSSSPEEEEDDDDEDVSSEKNWDYQICWKKINKKKKINVKKWPQKIKNWFSEIKMKKILMGTFM